MSVLLEPANGEPTCDDCGRYTLATVVIGGLVWLCSRCAALLADELNAAVTHTEATS